MGGLQENYSPKDYRVGSHKTTLIERNLADRQILLRRFPAEEREPVCVSSIIRRAQNGGARA